MAAPGAAIPIAFSFDLDRCPMNEPSDFSALPDTARLWVYVAAESFSPEVRSALSERVDRFLDGWRSHQRPVQGEAAIREDRFLLLAATLDGGDVSGCGIDASVHAIDEAAQALGISWAAPLNVVYRNVEGTVEVVSRSAFRRLVAEGAVTGTTPVFDPSITGLQELRAGAFEQPASASWHGRVFQIPEPA